VFEIAMDSMIARSYFQLGEYSRTETLHPPRLLLAALDSVASVQVAATPEYEAYIQRLRNRCGTGPALVSSSGSVATNFGDYLRLFVSQEQFDTAAAAELYGGLHGLSTIESIRRTTSELRKIRERPLPRGVLALVEQLADSLERREPMRWSSARLADNAEMVGLYGFVGGSIMAAIKAASQGDWRSLDRNLETGEFVNDPALASTYPDVPARNLGIALIIDSSGSMSQNDPQDLRKRGAELFVDLLVPVASITVIDFDSRATILADNTTDKKLLHSAIQKIDSSGGTNIGAAVKAAYDTLLSDPRGMKSALLLTDGIGTYNGEASLFKSQGWPIYTISLTGDANEELLRRIAGETGGLYFKARHADELQKLFGLISARVSNHVLISLLKGVVKAGETKVHEIDIDNTVRSIAISLLWPGSDLDLTAIDPAGNTHIPDIRMGTYESLRIPSPVPGRWTLKVSGIDALPQGTPYEISTSGDTPIRFQVSGLDKEYKPGETLSIAVETAGLAGCNGRMAIRKPNGEVLEISPDIDAGKVTFETSDTRIPGDYNIEYHVSGQGPSGIISRAGLQTIRIAGQRFDPGRGNVIRVVGSYVTVNIGRKSGVRPGIQVLFYQHANSAQSIAAGYVTEVQEDHCIVELNEVKGIEPIRGHVARLDARDWHADWR
jgi:uncharacterized protein YegL